MELSSHKLKKYCHIRGGSRDFEKVVGGGGGGCCAVCRPPWSADKENFRFHFKWSKRTKITLETISFWQNISISIFKFFHFYIQ